MKLKLFILALFGLATFSLLVLPVITLAGRWIGIQDLAGAAILLIYISLLGNPKHPNQDRLFLTINMFFLIFISFFLFISLTNNIRFTGVATPPTELWQYAKRLSFFYIGFLASSYISTYKLFRVILLISLFASLIGLLQAFVSGPLEWIIEVYARTEHQRDAILQKGSDTLRVYGVSGHSNSWGGICSFFIALSLPYTTTPKITESKSDYTIAAALLVTGTLNVILSGSRGAIAASVGVYLAFLFITLFSRKSGAVKKSGLMLAVLILIITILLALKDRINFLIYRFVTLIERGGGGRIEQIQSGLSLLDNPVSILLGIGNDAQRMLAVGHGIESAPIYLLVNYGIIGFSILYAILLVVALKSASLALRAPCANHQWALGVSGVTAVIGYLIFSTGYFFYQELIVGAFPWIFFGLLFAPKPKTTQNPSKNILLNTANPEYVQ